MSSSGTVRRIKDRGGSGGKVTASKPSTKSLTPIPEKANGVSKNPNGKENPRSVSATRRPVSGMKSSIKPFPIPRIDKSVGTTKTDDSRGGVRWSTSSIPRGRSSSPSDFSRLLSDRMSRVSVTDRSNERKPVNGSRVLERSQSQKASNLNSKTKVNEGVRKGFLGIGDCKNGVDLKKNVEKMSNDRSLLASNVKSTEKELVGVSGNYKGEIDSMLNLRKSSENNVHGYSDLNLKVKGDRDQCDEKVCDDPKEKGHFDLKVKEKVAETANDPGVVEIPGDVKDKGSGVEDNGVRPIKYPSKLHEKLAFLEGKVKRIASDIKRTKEMLDMNNPDASKVILSDIQDKISGVEKAMGHVVNDSHDSGQLPKMFEKAAQKSENVETTANKQVDQSKNTVKGLSHEELEARIFPHRKLLKSRTFDGASSSNGQNNRTNPPETSSDSKLEDVLLGPIDENPIALEFLASLNESKSNESARNEHAGLEYCKVQETDGTATSEGKVNSNMVIEEKHVEDIGLTTDETIDEFEDEQENRPEMAFQEEIEDSGTGQLSEIGRKTSTGGWFVSEGESVLLAHDDGSCTFYDITNSEEKAEYKPPAGVSPNLWGDCWLIRAPGSDGSSGRYVVAASSGSTLESGFCVWDFYTKDVQAFHVEKNAITSSRTVLRSLPNVGAYRRDALSTIMAAENRQWWYKPCGPLLVSTASSQRGVSIYDIRDGEQVMKWEVQKPVISMDYSSPLHWRNRGKVVIAETEAISLWDVNSLAPQALLSVASSGKVSALHVNNTDAELGGGVRRRVSSSEVEGNDGVFCTQDSINILDFRLPSGVGLKISKHGVSVQSIFSRGDSVFIGCSKRKIAVKEHVQSLVQQFSLRKGRIVSTYALPQSNAHFHYSAISQVWGNSDFVMGICGLGLFVFDTLQDEGTQSFAADYGKSQQVREIIGPDDLYSPSFDYLASRILVISRDRPALWRYLL